MSIMSTPAVVHFRVNECTDCGHEWDTHEGVIPESCPECDEKDPASLAAWQSEDDPED